MSPELEEERRLIAELDRYREESIAASKKLSSPDHSMLADEYAVLKNKADLARKRFHEAALSLRKYRKIGSS